MEFPHYLATFTLLRNWIGFCHGQILIETATYFYGFGGLTQTGSLLIKGQ